MPLPGRCVPGESRARGSQNLLDRMDRSLGPDCADADGKQPVEKDVLRCSRLEARECAEIVVRVVAYSGEGHVNEGPIVRLERHPCIELEGSIGLLRNPVAAAEHFAAQTIPF